jgi:biofilm PGA synthesis N-glycosyltransferase PgaC
VFGLLAPRAAARIPLLPAAASFVMLNTAALLALPASVALDPHGLWRKH